jgi:hypothetical protein
MRYIAGLGTSYNKTIFSVWIRVGVRAFVQAIWSKGCNSTTEIEKVIIKGSVSGQNRIPNHQTHLTFSWHMYQTQPVLDGKRLSTDSLVYQFLHDWKERYGIILRDVSNMLAYVKSKNIFEWSARESVLHISPKMWLCINRTNRIIFIFEGQTPGKRAKFSVQKFIYWLHERKLEHHSVETN